jgi:hypothetical protein
MGDDCSDGSPSDVTNMSSNTRGQLLHAHGPNAIHASFDFCLQGIIDWQLLLIQEFCDLGSLYNALQGRR